MCASVPFICITWIKQINKSMSLEQINCIIIQQQILPQL